MCTDVVSCCLYSVRIWVNNCQTIVYCNASVLSNITVRRLLVHHQVNYNSFVDYYLSKLLVRYVNWPSMNRVWNCFHILNFSLNRLVHPAEISHWLYSKVSWKILLPQSNFWWNTPVNRWCGIMFACDGRCTVKSVCVSLCMYNVCSAFEQIAKIIVHGFLQ